MASASIDRRTYILVHVVSIYIILSCILTVGVYLPLLTIMYAYLACNACESPKANSDKYFALKSYVDKVDLQLTRGGVVKGTNGGLASRYHDLCILNGIVVYKDRWVCGS